ncbi:hypothetical protein CDD83_6721 [Cordyceps sp. RAO-2017]|nr:hypothetical protein CDD83_6721 [Cordyceps sp. RAO-2017]
MYDTRLEQLPADAINGGCVGNFDREQASFSGEMGSDDSTTFARAIDNMTPAPRTFASRDFGCDGKCKEPARVDKLRVLGGQVGGPLPRLLFPGKQKCGGCSRSPAWDCLELPSQWFTGVEPAPTTNLSEVLGSSVTTPFALVDTWRKKAVSRLEGTVSHASDSFAWRLTRCELQCSDGDVRVNESSGSDDDGDVGSFRYQGMLNVVMCGVELYHIAAKLLEMRDSTMTSGLDTRIGGLVTSSRRAVFEKIEVRGALPPKLSGYATCPTDKYRLLYERERASGAMRNASVFAMSLVYNRTVYGGSLSGIWALMDSAFMFDYSMASCNAGLGNKVRETFWTVRGYETGNAALDAHILDIITVMSCGYSALKAKAELEDARELQSKPCIVVWDDLAALARYRLADAAFCHVFYDSPGDEASLAMVGLGTAIHDLIDIGPDVTCGEISNVVPTLTGGELSFERLRSVYIGLVATLEWFTTHAPFNPAALAIMMTHWWQLGNMRHRTVTLMSRVATSPEYAASPERLAQAPSLRTLTHENGIKCETGQAVLDRERAEMDEIEASGPAEIQALVKALVRPVLDYADGRESHLPIEAAFCADVLDACLSRQHSEKIRMLWRLTLVMWKCGAMWATVLASTQYAHEGRTNCDRGRDDLQESTWT